MVLSNRCIGKIHRLSVVFMRKLVWLLLCKTLHVFFERVVPYRYGGQHIEERSRYRTSRSNAILPRLPIPQSLKRTAHTFNHTMPTPSDLHRARSEVTHTQWVFVQGPSLAECFRPRDEKTPHLIRDLNRISGKETVYRR